MALFCKVYLKRVRKIIPENAATITPALAVDRKCLAARCHIIPACTVLVSSVLCILSPREMEGRGANSGEVKVVLVASKERSR